MATTEPNKIIYSMVGVGKNYDKRAVLKDIYLSYFYGAKIGVIGLNGSGKSSLLRIMAGVDKEFNGEAMLSPGYTVGFLEQEPLIALLRNQRQRFIERKFFRQRQVEGDQAFGKGSSTAGRCVAKENAGFRGFRRARQVAQCLPDLLR
jgi:ATPase subunit of ABC transporter with duplicated ATPase domains